MQDSISSVLRMWPYSTGAAETFFNVPPIAQFRNGHTTKVLYKTGNPQLLLAEGRDNLIDTNRPLQGLCVSATHPGFRRISLNERQVLHFEFCHVCIRPDCIKYFSQGCRNGVFR